MSNPGSGLPAGTVDGQVLTWSAAQGKWIAQAAGASGFPNTYSRAYRNAAQTIINNANVGFDTIDQDPGGNFSVAANHYTVPATGKYLVVAQVDMQSGGIAAAKSAFIAKGGAFLAELGYSENQSASFDTLQITDVFQLTAGDVLTVNMNGGASPGTALETGNGRTWFSVIRIA